MSGNNLFHNYNQLILELEMTHQTSRTSRLIYSKIVCKSSGEYFFLTGSIILQLNVANMWKN